jgi:predicted  nucleic acid-binding Zn-ribbon protein
MADLKADLVKLQKELQEFEKKEIEGTIPFHIQVIEEQIAHMKGLVDPAPASPTNRKNLPGHHGVISQSVKIIEQILKKFEELADEIRKTEGEIEQEKADVEFEQNKLAALSQTIRELGNSLLIQK